MQANETGSQTLEFALVLPLVAVAITFVLQLAVLGADHVVAHGLAREAARAAAVGSDGEARAAVQAAATGRIVEIDFAPPTGVRTAGDLVTATIRLRSRPLPVVGPAWIEARAVMRTEQP